jgi:GR25 family glycosyltransferase involved in LPS biosynthesis
MIKEEADSEIDCYLGKNGGDAGDAGRPKLKNSAELDFLKERTDSGQAAVEDSSFWSLHSGSMKLEPLKFTNGKTQEDVVREVVGLVKGGSRVILIKGMCGTGKSAIALNIARQLGKTAIVVPVKGLQRQYEEDYMGKKHLLNKNGKRMKIAMITGRENHDSIFFPGISCADMSLPDTIKITEKNSGKLREYYRLNPIIKNKIEPDIRRLRRISIAPANPYWSPIANAVFELPLHDATKKRYKGLGGKDFIFYHRKRGCSYFDQYQAYLDADAIIFNSAKYKIEVSLDRKPETEVDIIDEADEFLDNFSTEEELNLTRLASSINTLSPEDLETKSAIIDIMDLIELEERNKRALGIDEDRIYRINETHIEKILKKILHNAGIEIEASLDELNYTNHAVEVARNFEGFFDESYATFRRNEKDLIASIVTPNLSKKFHEIIEKNKAVILMSGTLHSEEVLRDVFGLKSFKIIEAETIQPGTIEIAMTGKEFDCKYSNFKSKKYLRKDYLIALAECIRKAKKPVLVHVNAFEDLPSAEEVMALGISEVMSREKLRDLQAEDKTGRMISIFKSKMCDYLFTTKCSRGVDFPGDICNSVVFTKYPNPNINGIFWKVLNKTHPEYFWEFYKDQARRDFLQRIYRAVRHENDHVYVLSPDIRVLDAVRALQIANKRDENDIFG